MSRIWPATADAVDVYHHPLCSVLHTLADSCDCTPHERRWSTAHLLDLIQPVSVPLDESGTS